VTLARLAGKTIAYVADEDSQSIHTIDVSAGREVATTSLAGAPAQSMVLADGRVVVTLRNKNAIEVLEPGEKASDPLTSRCTLQMPTEPFGLAATPDDKTLLVTSGWAHALVALDAAAMTQKFQVDLPREPRAIVVDEDGERAFVSHVVSGRVSVVDLNSAKHDVRDVSLSSKATTPYSSRGSGLDRLRTGSQGFALAKVTTIDKAPPPPPSGELPHTIDKKPLPKAPPAPPKPKTRVFAPMVTVDPGDPGVRSTAYYGDMVLGVARMVPMVNVIDPTAERSLSKTVLSLGDRPSRQCVLPRAVASRPSKGTLYVACLGIDAIVELDSRGLDPSRLEIRRFQVPAGPTGVAVDDKTGLAVVWSQFDPGVTILKLDDENAAPTSVAVRYTPSASVRQLAEGRKVFHHTDDARIASDGIACASCHPDGREDALTWATPDGPRQTIMLSGHETSTPPYGWAGKFDNLPDYVAETFRRLGGSGVTGHDLEALLTYVQGAPGPQAEDLNMTDSHKAMVARGKQLFDEEAQGCATCHLGGRGVDRTLHDVGSTAAADNLTKYDTPSLRFISGTAPYFHDGRYETLDDLLKASDHRMGHVLQLSQKDVGALRVYLETL
jgi:DNA-binding beta-propeller fold protein YncE/mono/diheme cytochrome c family protein